MKAKLALLLFKYRKWIPAAAIGGAAAVYWFCFR